MYAAVFITNPVTGALVKLSPLRLQTYRVTVTTRKIEDRNSAHVQRRFEDDMLAGIKFQIRFCTESVLKERK